MRPTLLLQILFAARFGSSLEAGGFILAFSVSVSVASIFITTATVLVLPRLVEPDGTLSARAMRALGAAGIGVLAVAAIVAAASVFAGQSAGDILRLSPSDAQAVLALSALIIGLFGLSGVVGAIALARGRRFVPSAAPTFPSAIGAMYLVTADRPTSSGCMRPSRSGEQFSLRPWHWLLGYRDRE